MIAKDVPILQRAYELARSGGYASVTALRRQLKKDGYDGHSIDGHTFGLGTRRELQRLMRQAREPGRAAAT